MILMALFNKHAASLATELMTGIVLIVAVTTGWFWLYNQLEDDVFHELVQNWYDFWYIYIVKARTENKAKELVWIVEANVTGNSWEDEYDVQELDIDNMNMEEVISGGS